MKKKLILIIAFVFILAALTQRHAIMSYYYISKFKISNSLMDNDKRLFLLHESFISSQRAGWKKECNPIITKYFEQTYLVKTNIIQGYVSECSVLPTGEILVKAFALQRIRPWKVGETFPYITDYLYIIYLEKNGDQYIEKGIYKRSNP
jgi:hypothetical protein